MNYCSNKKFKQNYILIFEVFYKILKIISYIINYILLNKYSYNTNNFK